MNRSFLRLALLYTGTGPSLFIGSACLVGLFLLAGGIGGLISESNTVRVRTIANIVEKGKGFNTQPPAPAPGGKGVKVQVGGDRDPYVYWLKYSYQDGQGHSHTQQGNIDLDKWNGYEKGGTIPVEYDRAHPENGRYTFEGERTPWWVGPTVFAGVGLLITAFASVCVISAWKDVVPRVRLIRDGVPALSQVFNVLAKETPSGVQGSPPVVSHHLQFEFIDSAGQVYVGESIALTALLQKRWPVGEPILILYRPENPQVHEPDLYVARAQDLMRLVEGGT